MFSQRAGNLSLLLRRFSLSAFHSSSTINIIACNKPTITTCNFIVPNLFFGKHFNINYSKNYSSNSDSSTSFNVQDEDDFQERVISAKIPIVVDFYAEWCGPCKLLGPKLEKEVSSHKGRVVMAKVDIDEMSDLAMTHKVNVVPTVVVFKNGKPIDRFEGNVNDDVIKSFIKKASLS